MAKTKSVLIIGGSGYVGSQLALKLREGYKVFATYYVHPIHIPGVTYIPMNVENRDWVKRVVYTARPDAIVYAAGKPNTAWAEASPRDADRIHTGGPATVSAVSGILQPKFIYLSSAYAFDGIKGNYKETDIVLPGNALGKSKVGGENFIRGHSLNHIILRVSPLFGIGNSHSISFLDRLRMHLDRGHRIELPGDELHSFVSMDGFIDVITHLIEAGIRNKTLHYGGLTKLNFYDFGREFAKRFKYDPNLIQLQKSSSRKPGETYDYSLNSTQAIQALKIKPLLLEEGFDLLEKNLISGL